MRKFLFISIYVLVATALSAQQNCLLDTIPPTVQCSRLITANEGETLRAANLIANSNDNCTPAEQLRFSFSSNLNDTLLLIRDSTVSYRLTVMVWATDSAGNQSTCNTVVLVCNPYEVEAVVTPACYDRDGSIMLNVINGQQNFSFQWSNGATTPNISNLGAGSYSVTIFDSEGCVITRNYQITSSLKTDLATTPDCGAGNGTATVTPTSGQAPFQYRWSNGDTVSTATRLSATANYRVTVTDATGCFQVREVRVPYAIKITPTVGYECGNTTSNNKSIRLQVEGGDGNYSYRWSNNSTTKDLNSIIAGNYTITVTDGAGCTATASVNVPAIQRLQVNLFESDVCDSVDINGTLTANANGGLLPYSYQWANTPSNQRSININQLGTYSVTVTDKNGCAASDTIVIEPNSPVKITLEISPIGCNDVGIIRPSVSGGTPPYIYRWSNNTTFPTLSTSSPGNHILTVTDVRDCAGSVAAQIGYVETNLALDVSVEINCDDEDNLFVIKSLATNGVAPYTYQARGPSGFARTDTAGIFKTNITGTYTITARDAQGCSITKNVVLSYQNAQLENCNVRTINLEVFLDANSNCQFDALSETRFNANTLEVALVKDTILDTDKLPLSNNGAFVENIRYFFDQVEEGRYRLVFFTQSALASEYQFIKITTNFPNACGNHYLPITELSSINPNQVYDNLQLPISIRANCPLLTVNINASFLRRCFSSTYWVQYCNYGGAVANDAFIDVELDPFLEMVSSPIAFQPLGNNLFRFFIADVAIGTCRRFPIEVKVSCAAALGQTHCTKARIFPDKPCILPLEWTGAAVEVEAVCEPDSVLFTIKNTGNGTMSSAKRYVVIEDLVMFRRGEFILHPQESIALRAPANGSTYRLEAEQTEYFPFPSHPSIAVEGCGVNERGGVSRGFITQFPQDEKSYHLSIDCQMNRGSYDPNDKQADPEGVGRKHAIEHGTELEYKIRFQNTGTDTAFTVVILDTLSAFLDPNSVLVGASSHPYTFDRIGDNVLRFRFDPIVLPDSSTNLSASQGFVTFRVSLKNSLSIGSLILNQAAIYFDYNEPIITNFTYHTLDMDFFKSLAFQTLSQPSGANITIFPNPMQTAAHIQLHDSPHPDLTFTLRDALGIIQLQAPMTDNTFFLRRNQLRAGIYLFEITSYNHKVGQGKIVISD
ncbi:MAG: T9SS type A sorting domain-containing protein [Saprospiraceae bacterium]|nr:T9SS type A sorting domain-containing protein [Saprospiraceae bacterium]